MLDPPIVPESLRLSIAQLARREGVHAATPWRWILNGVKGQKLRAVRIGGRRYVLECDWQRFIAALNSNQNEVPFHSSTRAERAEAELDKRLGDTSKSRKNARA